MACLVSEQMRDMFIGALSAGDNRRLNRMAQEKWLSIIPS
jgi:hypothetical protein